MLLFTVFELLLTDLAAVLDTAKKNDTLHAKCRNDFRSSIRGFPSLLLLHLQPQRFDSVC